MYLTNLFKKLFNIFSSFLSNKKKKILSALICDWLLFIKKTLKISFLKNYILPLALKAEKHDIIKNLFNDHQDDVETYRYYEKSLRYQALGKNCKLENRFLKDSMLNFESQEKYQELISFNNKAIEKFPKDILLCDRLAKNYIANGNIQKSLFYFNQSLKIQRNNKVKNNKFGNIIMSSLPRSAGDWLSKSIVSGLDLKRIEIPYFDSWYPDYCIINFPNYYKHHKFTPMPEGFWSGHIPALKNNLINLSFLTDKMIVNFRDPRQQMISFYHHLERMSIAGNYLGLMQYKIPENYFFWSFEKKIDWHIEDTIPKSVDWINGWLNANKHQNVNLEILYINHHETAKNQDLTLKKILSFYNIDEKKFNFPQKPKFQNMTHNRLGSVDEWKKILSNNQINKVNNLIPSDWLKKYNWEF